VDVVPWVNSYKYHLPILEFEPDFSIAPLVPNYFNFSKSDIKYIEACAYQAVFMGSVFTNGMPSPYDNCMVKVPDNFTPEQIEEQMWKHCEPEIFNKIIRDQYEMLEKDGRWLESDAYINQLTKIF
jgi:hypothetical protein